MRIFLSLVLSLSLTGPVVAETEREHLPDFDIAVFDVQFKGGKLQISRPIEIAKEAGYENQPAFAPDSKSLFFSRVDDGVASIWNWNERRGAMEWAKSSLNEYSPLPMPFEANTLSMVAHDLKETGKLWSYSDADGFRPLFQGVGPLGYYAWSGKNIAFLVLGNPSELQVSRFGKKSATKVDTHLGRCLQKVPGRDAISYTVEKQRQHRLKVYDFGSKQTTSYCELPKGIHDYVWLNSKTILTSDGNKLLFKDVNDDLDYSEVENFSSLQLSRISRLALSPDGTKLAVVFIKKSWRHPPHRSRSKFPQLKTIMAGLVFGGLILFATIRQSKGDRRWNIVVVVLFLGYLTVTLLPNFKRAQGGSDLTACKSNLKNLGTAMEMYSTDWSGHYPVDGGPMMTLLTPKYLKALPECPAAGSNTYRAEFGPNIAYNEPSFADYYFIECSTSNHTVVSVPANYPQYDGISGLIER